MTRKDPWAKRWQVYKGQLGGGRFLAPVSFTLVAVRDRSWGGGVAFYRVTKISPKEMRPHWQKVRLFPRGSRPSESPQKPLPKWSESCDATWESAARLLRDKYAMPKGCFPGINPTIRRLEGDMHPLGDAEALTIVCVDSAVVDKSDRLVLILKSLKEYSPREDGTAHGGSPG
jgi:hypothetical protein